MTTYIALIHKDAESDYGVSFPDLPGCVTAGSTLDEAMAMAREALALHIEGLLEEGADVPAPRPPDAINREEAVAIAAIDVPEKMKVERVNITIPALSLQRFDAFAARRGMTRSGLFVEAVHRWIQAIASAQVSKIATDIFEEELAQAELGRQNETVGSSPEGLGDNAPRSDERIINLMDALRRLLKNEQLPRGKVKKGRLAADPRKRERT
jgi:predicted RNase H-like HicB family nuclease